MEQDLPPGFRFHPTDEELIVYYLCNQYTSKPCPASSIIPEVDIYKFDPPDLPKKAGYGEKEWYFFSPRERKYPNGVRPNRATVSGYWKATGTDKAIHSGCKHIGVKKSLVFYKGKPPKGIKTGWIMHEYRLVDQSTTSQHHVGSMRLDDWVLCRIYKKKKNMGKTTTVEEQGREEFPSNHQNARDQIMDSNYLGSSVSQMFSDGRYNNYSSFDLQNNVSSSNSGIVEDYFVKPHMFAEDDYGGKFQAMMKQSSSIVHSNQPMFVNQVYHLGGYIS